MREILSIIAAKHLNVPTLDARGSDSLDFHELHVSSLNNVLVHAYRAGQISVAQPAPVQALLPVLLEILQYCADQVELGVDTASEGNQNGAIGAILCIDNMLPAALSIYQAAIALHRGAGKGGAA